MGNIDKKIIKARTMTELNKLLAREVRIGWYAASEVKHFDEQYGYQVLLYKEKMKTGRVSV